MSTVSGLSRPSYFDVQSTTQTDPRVLDKMLPYMISEYGNPHSKTHSYGARANEAVETARTHVASLINADPREIVFTSGATESNNAAIKGVAKFYAQKNKKKIITTQTDHKCVLDSCRRLQEEGFTVEYLKVNTNGIISLEDLAEAIDETTSLVSIMAVNNEIGVIQPLEAIGALCRSRKVFFHTDAAQAVGKIPLDVDRMRIDLLSISGHKIYGPKGVGALYIRRKPRVRLVPLINGGGQERGLRSGTLPPALVVGLGEACRLSLREMDSEVDYLNYLSRKFANRVECEVPEVVLNGHREQRIPGNLNYSFAYVEGESLMTSLGGLAVSSGSACTSDSLEPSYVLRAIGVNEELAHTSLRIGLGRFTTEAEVDSAVDQIKGAVEKLRELSPLYEMAQEGIDLSTIEWNQPH